MDYSAIWNITINILRVASYFVINYSSVIQWSQIPSNYQPIYFNMTMQQHKNMYLNIWFFPS